MTENTTDEATIERTKSAARNAAEKRLREANADELRQYMEEEYAARGLEYKPRLSKEERARKEIERLAKEHGISLAFDVETAEDAQANVDIQQANYTDVDDPERVALARERIARANAVQPY